MREETKEVKSTTDGNSPESTADDEYINLKVAGQDGSFVHFKIKKVMPLRKLMTTYCGRLNLSMENVRFRFDGEAISEKDSPVMLQMEENDTIEVFQQQSGGCKASIPNGRFYY